MTTGAISYRVADFLKGYPPFSFIDEEELREFASHGRVCLHEDGDLIYEEGDPQGLRIAVIRQGSVRLSRTRGESDELVDMLGRGDLLGIGAIVGRMRHRAAARAVHDTIVYSFSVDSFRQLCAGSSEARRFLSVYLALAPSVSADVEEIDSKKHQRVDWMRERGLHWDEPRCAALICSPETAIREVGSLMRSRSTDNAVICDGARHPVGIVTTEDFMRSVATGQVSLDAPASAIMTSPVLTTKPDFTVGPCILSMMNQRRGHICVTEDGTPQSAVLAVVSETNLMLHYGNNPLVLLREIDTCDSIGELGALRKRIDALILTGLHSPDAVDWCCDVIGEAHLALISRVVNLAMDRVEAPNPKLDFTFLLVGGGGRSEILARNDLSRALIYEEPPFGQEAAVDAYFAEFAAKVHEGLETCGFSETFEMSELNRRWRQPEVVWQRLFSAWIREPLNEEIHKALAFFDFAPLHSNHPLAVALHDYVKREIRTNKRFLPLLANDAMREPLPLTFFNDDAVTVDGGVENKLRIKDMVTQPIVEIARIFALKIGAMDVTNTLKRLRLAGEQISEGRDMFQAAARAFRIGSYFRAVSGIRQGDDGAVIEPAEFSRGDQALLKSCFPVIGQFQDFAARHFGLRD